MDIKIIYLSDLGTGGDCISHYTAEFETNPTLDDFVNWLLNNRRGEWGYIETKTIRIIEYRYGQIIYKCDSYDELKDKTISLKRIDGGWSRDDYTIEFENGIVPEFKLNIGDSINISHLKSNDINFLIGLLDDIPTDDIRKPIAEIIKKKLNNKS